MKRRLTPVDHRPRHRVLALMLLGPALLAGCKAGEVTTRRGLQGTTATMKGTSYVLRATGNASVTEPDMPRLARAAEFFDSQRDRLARQAAVGGGEDIDALAVLLGKTDRQALAGWMQTHYNTLFSDRTVAATKVVRRLDAHNG